MTPDREQTNSQPDLRDAREFAWRVHEAQESWIGKVDVKASVVLAFEAAVFVLALTNDDLWTVIQGSSAWVRVLGYVGVAFLFAAVACIGAAVWPMTGKVRNLRNEAADHLVYFGHLRHVTEGELAQRLRNLTSSDELAMLARQIVSSSRTNWWKHRMIQYSLAFAFTGLAALTVLVILHTGARG